MWKWVLVNTAELIYVLISQIVIIGFQKWNYLHKIKIVDLNANANRASEFPF